MTPCEITEVFTKEELTAISKKWHEIDKYVNETPEEEIEYPVTYENEWHIDRDIFIGNCKVWITTDLEDGETFLSPCMLLYTEDDDYETDIMEIDDYLDA